MVGGMYAGNPHISWQLTTHTPCRCSSPASAATRASVHHHGDAVTKGKGALESFFDHFQNQYSGAGMHYCEVRTHSVVLAWRMLCAFISRTTLRVGNLMLRVLCYTVHFSRYIRSTLRCMLTGYK